MEIYLSGGGKQRIYLEWPSQAKLISVGGLRATMLQNILAMSIIYGKGDLAEWQKRWKWQKQLNGHFQITDSLRALYISSVKTQ